MVPLIETDYQVGVVLVGPGETKETPIYGTRYCARTIIMVVKVERVYMLISVQTIYQLNIITLQYAVTNAK